ncbi:uncharacterized protein [Rutidosis leptorrhynchoides]|uniref:uncharacterized protein n=1 Tax=Rutidosis leptorrhynchoides TaxID=125765 RepID=UPI003A9A18C4
MNFDRGFRIPYTENRDSWKPLINGMPIPIENGIGHGQGSMPIMSNGNEFVGGWDPTLASRRPILMNNRTLSGQQSCTTNDNGNYWSSPTEKMILQGNGSGENGNHWTLNGNERGGNGNHWSIHGNEFDESRNSWNPVTTKKIIYEKPHPTHVEMQERRVETENWQDLIGMYTGVLPQNTLDSNKIHEDSNRRPPKVVPSNEKPKWVTRPSRRQDHVSNQASNFISTDPANWKCGNSETIVSSSSNLTCVSSANEACNNGVYDLRLLFNQNRPTQVESNIMRTTSWTSTLENHPAQRSTSNNLISRPKDGFPGANQHAAYDPSSPPTFKPDATAFNILNSYPFDPITPYSSQKYKQCQWVPKQVNFQAAETFTPVKQSNNYRTVSTKDADDLYNELLQTINNSPPSSAISTSQNENVRSNERDELVFDLNQTPEQQTPDTNKNFPFAPVTPYNQQSQWVAEKVNFLAEETSTTDQTVSTKDADYLYNELVQTIGDSPPSAMSSTQKEQIVSNEREEQVIDLNQTPQQKTPSRRKKHRPKVIRESKPRRTPKPKEPANGSTHETPKVKRKHVRKQGVNSGENTPVESVTKRKYVRKNDISEPPSVVETAPKSCKKKLNFDLECPPQDESHENIKSQQEVYINLNSQETQQNRRIDGVRVTQHNEYTGGNKVNDRVGIKDNFVQANTVPIYVQGTPIIDERRGIKRPKSNANALDSFLQYQKFLLGVANRSYDQKSFNLFDNHKKLKMQNEYQDQDLEDNARQINNIYRNSVGSAMQLLNSCIRVDQSCTVVNSQPPLDATRHLQKQHVLPGMQPRTMRASNYTPSEMISWKPIQTTPKWDSRYTVSTYPSANSFEKKQNAKPRSYNQRLDGLSQNLQQQHQGYQQASTIARGRQRTKKVELSVETITHMLEGLHIYDGNKKLQNQLIVYRNSDAMIPFEPIKKRAPRPRVDLDTETERVWRQLMGIEGSEGPTTKDKDKEKWWEDERRVFRGRAESFIARMHLVQGDRRFSRWKGSVVDSVIGVFLTQNVSDHLSSSAFMSLAARFPLKSTSKNELCCQDRVRNGPYSVTEPIEFTKSSESIKNMTHRTSLTKGAMYNHNSISVEEVILPQDSFSSSTIDEFRSSSGSNSHVDDVTITGFKTRKQSGPLLNLMQDYNPMFGGIPNMQNSFENTVYEASSKQKASHDPPTGPEPNSSKGSKVKNADERKQTMHWDSLRKEALLNGKSKERNKDAADSLDYEALRRAHVDEISDAIRERGMNNMLADRMKDFLNRLVRDHGSIDLEWLRDAPPDKAKDYLLSFRGLGLKSVECVRLLTLHHLAFPVDTNVGRIAVRLGWVPLQPLPESLQLHLLEMYPILESIQKYLWPRLCKLDQLTLYELHYQMITFGKVFCTKSKPNCNACPMRAECRHFASAYASARLALPGPEEKRIVTSDAPVATPIPPIVNMPLPLPLPPAENNFNTIRTLCEPIIEEPSTPEPEVAELTISDIEDQYYGDDYDEIPSIKLNMEEFTTNLQNIIQDSKELQENMSKALVALNPNAASIPTPKLKDVSRLRTEHLVYELPDSHPLLDGFDKREPDDPSHYLLAIWTPGETANSVQPPEIECPAQQSGRLCDRATCFSCNNVKESNSQVVRGTILIPCRTAMRGSFPLNGTYFQVNEMFADHESSLEPIAVPRAWIWNLPRRKVYFGTSVTTIFKGLSTEGIQYCFWKGFVCVRGFDRIKRAPRPLMARLHFPASKLLAQRMKKTTNNNK